MEKQTQILPSKLQPVQIRDQKRQFLKNERVQEYHSFFRINKDAHHFGEHKNKINNYNQEEEIDSMGDNYNLKRIFQEKLESQGIKVNNSGKFEPFNFKILKSSINFEIVLAQIKWGFASLQVKILNSRENSLFHSRRCSKGCNGTVYYIQDEGRCFAVKCNFIKSNQQEIRADLKVRVLQEYFISKMASALECGPNVTNYAGFDLFFNEDCIQFSLQQCFEPQKVNLEMIEKLKQNLRVLHLSNIVHFDIKNQNIMWSKSLKKLVFIDFGLSQLIDGGPEFKYPCTFKGTLNYCSRQMAVAFESNQTQFIDIYYNDIVCLSSSIVVYKHLQNPSENSVQYPNEIVPSTSKYDLYVQDYVKNIAYITNDNSFMVEFKIIMLKYYIYIKDTQKIDTIYNQSDEINCLIFSSKILSFIKEMLPANQMKQFYRKYISKYIKDTVEYGWVQKWSKGIFSTLNYQQKNSPQTKSIYQSYYSQFVGEQQLRKQLFKNLNKVQIMSLLMQNSIENKQIYFHLFVRFISFINNQYDVQERERNLVFQHFNRYFWPSTLKQKNQMQQKKEISQLLFQKLSIIFQYILASYLTIIDENYPTEIDNQNRMNTIIQIMEHILFFALFTTQKVICLLEKIYNLSIWSVTEKLQIIVRIIVINDWNIAPLFKRKNISLKTLQYWTDNRLKQLYCLQIKPPCIGQILSFRKSSLNKFDVQICNDQQILNNYSSNFRFYLQLIQFSKRIVQCNSQTLIKINTQILQIVPNSLQARPFPIHFMLFSLFQSKVNNVNGCRSIINLIQRNLRSVALSSNLILHNVISVLQKPLQKVLLKQTTLLLPNIGTQNITFFFVILYDSINTILSYWMKYTKNYNIYQSEYNHFLKQLQNLVNRLDYKREAEDQTQKCSLREYCNYYFDFKLLYNKFTNKLWNYMEEISLLQKQRHKQDCQSCFAGMTGQLQRFIREYKLSQCSRLPQQQLIHFYLQTKQLSKYLQNSKQNNCQDQSLKNLSLSTSFAIIKSLILQGNITPQLFDIIYDFLLECKEDLQLQSYFINFDSCPRMIELTLASIQYKNGVLSMTMLIKKLLKIWRLLQQPQCLQNLMYSFYNLISGHVTIGTEQKMKMILQELGKQQNNFPEMVAFYYSYFIHTKEEKRRYAYLIKIFQLLQNLPHKIATFLQAKLYYHLLYAQKALFANRIKISCQNNMKCFERKLLKKSNWLKKQLIKIAKSLPIFAKFSKKQKKARNLKISLLHMKCYCIGTYKLRGEQSFQLYLTPKVI